MLRVSALWHRGTLAGVPFLFPGSESSKSGEANVSRCVVAPRWRSSWLVRFLAKRGQPARNVAGSCKSPTAPLKNECFYRQSIGHCCLLKCPARPKTQTSCELGATNELAVGS